MYGNQSCVPALFQESNIQHKHSFSSIQVNMSTTAFKVQFIVVLFLWAEAVLAIDLLGLEA